MKFSLIPSKKFVMFSAGIFGAFTAFGRYMNPNLFQDTETFSIGYRRYLREVVAAIRIGASYKWNWHNITSELHYKNARIMYEMMETNGGVYIKAGQSVSQMDSLIPDEYIEVFEPMQQRAPTSHYAEVRKIVQDELGCRIEDVFSEFDETPVASASLAQVHRARVRETGELVAVKVQHAVIKKNTEADLAMCVLAGNLCEWLFPNFRYKWAFDETALQLPKELDFTLEIKNAQRCAEIFEGHETIKVPKTYPKLSSERVLTMTFEKGVSVTKVREMAEMGIDLKDVARLISEAFVHMTYTVGFVHGDPHPGNMFIRRKEGGGPKDIELVLLDHGIYAELSDETRINYALLWRGILDQNEQMIRTSSTALGADLHDLFAAMIADRKYEDLMDDTKKHQLKSRLKDKHGDAAKKERHEAVRLREKEIAETLRDMNRELIILMKSNHYLRSIDIKLGNPTNTFNQVNNMTWKIFMKEKGKTLDTWSYCKHVFNFYYLKFGLFAYYVSVNFRYMLGFQVSKEELEDFDMDFTDHTDLKTLALNQ